MPRGCSDAPQASRGKAPQAGRGKAPPAAAGWIRVVVVVVVAALAAACGSQTGSSRPTATPSAASREGTFPVTVKAANGAVTIRQRPQRIVSLSSTATEMLFAIGAGGQVAAVDDQSNYPPQAPRTKLSGFRPNVEAIAKLTPDLVVISYNPHDLERSLQTLHIPVLLTPAAKTLDDTYAQLRQLGVASGHLAEAARQVASMRSRIGQLVASAPKFDRRLTYYHELDQTYYTVTSATFIGQLYGMLGLANIADKAKGAAAGYPQLSAEFIVKADPDIVFLADTRCCGQSAATVARRPGWAQLTAVRTGAVVALDDDIASRWGPRVVDYLQAVVQALARLHQRVGG